MLQRILITTALLCACAFTVRAQLGPVTVQATLKKADGTLCNGSITLAYPTFTSPDGQYNVAGSVTTTVTSGVLSVTLEPGGYSAQYALAPDGCGPSVELWGVPQSPTPVTLAQVTTLASGFCSVQGTLWPIGCGYGIGTALPAACSVGQTFFLTSTTAGSNWYGCTVANTWTLEGGGGGGSPSFSAITNGTNTGHTLTVGNSTVLGPTGTGIVNANELNAGTVPATTQFLGSNSSNQVIPAPYIGSALPGTCSVGQVFFLTTAMLGLNWYGCTSTNTWTQQGGSGGAGTPPYSVGVSSVSSYTIPEATHLQGTSPLVWLFGTNSTTYTVTGSTNASPIVVTVSSTSGLTGSSVVSLSGVLGNTAANGIFAIGSVTGTTFTLLGSTGNGAWTSGGTVAIGSQAEAPNYFRDAAGDVFLTFNPPFSGVIEVGSGNSGGGGGGGGGGSFTALTSGVNSGGNTLTVGSTSSLTFAGTGIVNANQLNGLQPPATTSYLATNGSRQLIAAVTPLLPANNLSDLANVVTARTNLGLGSFALKNSLVSGDIPNNAANTTGNAGTATMLASSPSQCPTGPQQFSTGITANGNPNCSEVSSGSISGILGVAVGGTGTGTAFTPGSVVFAGASGVYTQDNANFFWDSVNHRLGLGTMTPASTLDVESSVGAIFTRALGSSTQPSPQAAMILGLSNTVPNVVGGGPAFVFRASNNALGLVFTGRVGTAWENPVAGSEAASLIFTSRSPSDTTASTERMRIDSQGNILIAGITDAGYNFDVQNSGSVGTARFFNQTSTTGTTRVQISRGAGDTTATNTLASDASASLFGLSLTGLSTGSIPFIGASGLVNQNNANFNWNNSIGQLTIGGSTAGILDAGSNTSYVFSDAGFGLFLNNVSHVCWTNVSVSNSACSTGIVQQSGSVLIVTDGGYNYNLRDLAAREMTLGASTSAAIPTGTWTLDLRSSGSTGTLRIWDQTATTGASLEILQAGAGQSGNLLNVNNNSGVTQASIDSSYHFNAPQFTVNAASGAILNTSLSLAATGFVNWTDACITHNATGVLEIDNCTLGALRDLTFRNLTLSSLASAGTQCVQVTSAGLLQGTGGACPGGGGGGVSSVGLSMPTVLCLTVTGSPVTTTGVLTCNIGTQSANTFLRGPTSGSAAAPAWGPLVAADLPGPGSTTQVAYNLAGVLTGSANLTYVSPALTIGAAGAMTGQLILQNGGTSGLGVTVQNNIATSAYNFNLPATAGTAGNPLCSGGGGAFPMTWCTVTVANGGTGQVTLTNHGVLVGAATAAVTQLAAAALGTVMQGNGASSDPSFTATPILGVAGTTLGTLRFAGNTSGTVTVESAAAAGTWTMVLPTGTGTAGQLLSTDGAGVTSWTSAAAGAWNSLGNAVSPLTLSNGSQATTFNQTSAVNWTWANTTVATLSGGTSSPIINLNDTYFNGSASASDGWTLQTSATGTGSNNPSTLTFAHTGSTLSPQTIKYTSPGGFASWGFTYSVTGATNATPIVITVASTSGLSSTNIVSISGVVGNTAANGTWQISSLSGTTFQLVGSQGNGAYSSGGTVTPQVYNDSMLVVTGVLPSAFSTIQNLQFAVNGGDAMANTFGIESVLNVPATDTQGNSPAAIVATVTEALGGVFAEALETNTLCLGANCTLYGIIQQPTDFVTNTGPGYNCPGVSCPGYANQMTGIVQYPTFTNALSKQWIGLEQVGVSNIQMATDATSIYVSQMGQNFAGTPQSVVYNHGLWFDAGSISSSGTAVLVDAAGPCNSQYPGAYTITGATNATPIVITVTSITGISLSDTVVISGVLGNTAANGVWQIQNISGNTFQLVSVTGGNGVVNSVGNGGYSGGGNLYLTIGNGGPISNCTNKPSGIIRIEGRDGSGNPVPMDIGVAASSGTKNNLTFIATQSAGGFGIFSSGGLLNLSGVGVYMTGVGSTSAGDRPLCLGGSGNNGLINIATTGTACGTSLRATKDNIQPLTGGLDAAMRMNPVTFDWKANGSHDIGLIAEEVEAINPLMAGYGEDGRLSNYKDRAVLAVAIRAIQELEAQVTELKAQLSGNAPPTIH